MKKIIYVVIVFLLGIFVAYLTYNTNKYQYILDLVTESIEEEKYDEVAKIFGGCCDTNELVLEKTEAVDLLVYSGTSISDVTYNGERSYTYEPTYYFYLFNVDFAYQTLDGSSNKTSLVFNFENGNSYTYPFEITEYVNTDYLEKENFTRENALLRSARSVSNSINTWDFMYVNFTKSMLDYMTTGENEGQKIVGFDLKNNVGEVVLSKTVNLDFSQQFFSDVDELIVEYNKWLVVYNDDDKSSAEKKTAQEEFNTFYDPWLVEFEANKETTGYAFPYGEDVLVPMKILWQTAGGLTIYTLVCFGFFILFFHFSVVKKLFAGIFGKFKKNKKSNKPIVTPKKETIIEAVEEPKEEPVETEVIEENKEETVTEEIAEVVETVENSSINE